MAENAVSNPGIIQTIRRWCKEEAASRGRGRVLPGLLQRLWEFVRDSSPSRRRQRYGDVDYDWDHRVDTTSATVGWRNRLLGMFHSPYQPTEPALFREMMAELKIDFHQFTFIDIGSGKGRVLLMASDYPFRRILGIELLPELHRIAQENIAKYKSETQQCFAIEAMCGDAQDSVFPHEPTVLYLFNPLPETALRQLLTNLAESLRDHPREMFVLYHNPLLEQVLTGQKWLHKLGGTHQYAIFEAL